MSHIDAFQSHLDRFLPSTGQKCELFACVPGKIWLVLALLSIIGSVNMGWKTLLTTVAWEVMVGWGIAWLCRGCSYGWLWGILVLFAGIPLAVMFGALVSGQLGAGCGCNR